ncbi:DUF805 domain-containing protein [Enterobacteriaceae bacterium ESL0689]|nr:DUF805 domain-containing protein [Enterobacteriaceae bacterium ESL0689]
MSESFWHCYWQGWRKTFVYRGCASRQAFWSFIIINILIILLLASGSYLWLTSLAEQGDGGMVLVWVYYVYLPLHGLAPMILFLPILSLGIRRMHDIGYSGWWFGGIVLINVLVIPVVMTGCFYLLRSITDGQTGYEIMYKISNILNIFFAVPLVWLCCKPSKLKDSKTLRSVD